jgi:hypothetical protein
VAVPAAQLDLAAPASNGGGTANHMPGPASVALDTALAIHCPATDQRGIARPQGSACDVGAVERQPGFLFADGFEFGDTSAWSSAVP